MKNRGDVQCTGTERIKPLASPAKERLLKKSSQIVGEGFNRLRPGNVAFPSWRETSEERPAETRTTPSRRCRVNPEKGGARLHWQSPSGRGVSFQRFFSDSRYSELNEI